MRKIELLDEVRYVLVDAGVRYYEDSTIDGNYDISVHDMYESGNKENAFPKMPCVEQIKERPTDNIHTDHLRWRPIIDIKDGIIINWTKGTTAHVFYKICDDGTYSLLDADKKVLYEVDSYVPDFLAIEDSGFGDYIDIVIDENGKIKNWSCNEDDLADLLKNSFGWCDDED